jgi:hypothetical protein
MILPTPRRCFFPECSELGVHRHHVVYEPDVIRPLCIRHHEEITMLNGLQARRIRRGLTRRHRWWIWFQWIEGKLKPRRTKKALEWVEAWNSDDEEERRAACRLRSGLRPSTSADFAVRRVKALEC